MKLKPLISLSAMLLLAFSIMFVVSLRRENIPLWDGAELTVPTIADELFGSGGVTADTAAMATADKPDGNDVETAPIANVRQPMDTTAKTILFIGDSMLDGLQPRMAAYAAHNGHKLYGVRWYSSTTEVWGRSTRLAQFIKQYNPDYVLVCLGSNELFVRDIKSKRQRYLDEILSQIGSLPYIWIGPPNWKDDTGINEMLESTCRKGSFYLSKNDTFQRAKDGAHPTKASAALWCDRVCDWIVNTSYYPIRLDKPIEKYGKSTGTVVLQPNQK